jgi:hypothetical protein
LTALLHRLDGRGIDPKRIQGLQGSIAVGLRTHGVGLGLLAVVAGVAAPFTGGGSIAAWLTISSVAFGVGSAALDGKACLSAHDNVACAGFALGTVGTGFGIGGAFAPAMGLTTVGEQAGFAAVGGGVYGLTAAGVDALGAAQAERQKKPGC